jgi:hypothetical protein
MTAERCEHASTLSKQRGGRPLPGAQLIKGTNSQDVQVRNMIAKRKNQAFRGGAYEPTPMDIRRSCDEIQATWSPRQRAKRDRSPRVAWWTVPMIRVSDIVEAMNGERVENPPYGGAGG